jgi:hypothetical protein
VPHVVVVGDPAPATMLAFFEEFFDDDRLASYPSNFNSNTVVVLLATQVCRGAWTRVTLDRF